MKNIKGSLILLITAFIWGSAFVAQTAGSKYIGPFTFNATRSLIGSLFLLIIIVVMGIIRRVKKDADDNVVKNQNSKWPIAGGILCGAILFFATGTQQWGVSIYPDDAAVAGRAGFLTAIYVVLVAVCEQFRGKKLHWLIIVSVVGAIVGMYFLCISGGFSNIYMGDVLEIACAICFTVHILVVDKFKDTDSFKLSCIQFFTCGILSLIVCFIRETIVFADIKAALFSILYAGIMSSGIAYTLQMVGQKYAEPAVASVVMSLESVFAALTGWIILHEILSGRELVGCALVFAAVIIAQIPQLIKKQ